MEWKLLELKNVQLKPIYEISENGDIRRSDSGKNLTGHKSVTLTLVNGAHMRFFRRTLVRSVFDPMDDVEWRPVKIRDGLELLCQYMISEDGHLRRVNTDRRLTYHHLYQLKTNDGKIRRLSTQKLVRMAFPEVCEMLTEKPLSVLLQSLNGFISSDYSYSHICIAVSIREKNTITLSHERFDTTIRVHYDGTNFIVNMLGKETVQSNRKEVESMIKSYITEVMV